MSMLAAFVVVVLIYIITHFFNPCRKANANLRPPGPRWNFPIVGHLPLLGFHPEKTLLKWKKIYGPIVFVQMGSFPAIVLNDIKMIKEAFRIPTLCGRPNVRIFKAGTKGGKGITIADDNKEQRQFIVKALNEFGLRGMSLESTINEEVTEVLNTFESSAGKPFRVHQAFHQSIINTMWNCIMSTRFPKEDDTLRQLANKIDRLAEVPSVLSVLGNTIPWISDWIPNLCGYNHMLQNYTEIHDFMNFQIEEHRRTRVKGAPRDVTDAYLDKVEETTDSKSTFFDKNNHQPVTNGDLFMGAMETTGMALEWTLLYLAMNQEVQQKLQSEILNVVGELRLPSLTDRPSMPYTEAVIHEVLRMSSLAPLGVGHAATDDTEFAGYLIPKGTMIISNIYGVQHDPEVWEDPEVFRPERFLNKSENKFQKSEHFIVFSTGKRSCIGESLSRDQLFLFITRIFQKFHVKFAYQVPTTQGIFGVVLRPVPYDVIFTCVVDCNKSF